MILPPQPLHSHAHIHAPLFNSLWAWFNRNWDLKNENTFIVIFQCSKHLACKTLPDTSGMWLFVGAKHLFRVDFVSMQTIWPYNLHTTLDGNSNLYNVHAHGRPLAHHHISFAILYSARLACMQNIGRSPANQNKTSWKRKFMSRHQQNAYLFGGVFGIQLNLLFENFNETIDDGFIECHPIQNGDGS